LACCCGEFGIEWSWLSHSPDINLSDIFSKAEGSHLLPSSSKYSRTGKWNYQSLKCLVPIFFLMDSVKFPCCWHQWRTYWACSELMSWSSVRMLDTTPRLQTFTQLTVILILLSALPHMWLWT
jgi:hypothetical protein